MPAPRSPEYDPTELATSLPSLALLAPHATSEPSASRSRKHDVAAWVASLQRQVQGQPSSSLARWLENVRRLVEAA
jgi:hypothetical protein